ncbi:hypothetical protein [Cryobacterium sp. Y82]|uniref:hypothetical protein n=1 Tax=Cryobacterium sp. Y82 TaxID=2045017 RepID=UPI001E588926|nr:hypothetical protein [Cryobacterium sp. Y82]
MAAPPTAVAVSSTWSAPARIIGINANPEKLTLTRNLAATGAYSSGEAEEPGIYALVVVEAAGHSRAQMRREGRLPVTKLTSSVIVLDKISEAMDELVDGKAIRQIVVFNWSICVLGIRSSVAKEWLL